MDDRQRNVGIERRKLAVRELHDHPEDTADRGEVRPSAGRDSERKPVCERAVTVAASVPIQHLPDSHIGAAVMAKSQIKSRYKISNNSVNRF